MNLYEVYTKCVSLKEDQLDEGLKDLSVDDGELLQAALAHLFIPGEQFWPWENKGAAEFRQIDDPIENLTVAEGFLYAERTRLTMLRDQGLPVVGGMIVLAMDETDVAGVVSGLREVHRAANELKNS